MSTAAPSSNRRLIALVLLALGIWFFKDSFTGTDAPPVRKPARATPIVSNNQTRAQRNNPPEDVCTVPSGLPEREADRKSVV
jgi:hypothetical protein